LADELAIYDMDLTITRRATLMPFLWHAAVRLAPWRLLMLPAALPALIAYQMRWIDRGRLKEILQRVMLGPHCNRTELRQVAASFAEETLIHNIYPGALSQIASDRAAGRRLVMATASYRLYAEAIAQQLGFDDVIATNSLTGPDDRVIARIDGENCYGPAKLRMIERWMAEQGIARHSVRIRFYSDHASDAPVLAWADEAFAVNAHDRLRKIARSRSWTIVDWND